MATDPSDRRLRPYLLGVLPEDECTTLEEEYFAREETLDRVWAAEHELIDDYLEEQLSREERERFEQHYLASPGHQQRLATARQLRLRAAAAQEIAAAEPPPSRSIFSWLFQQPLAFQIAYASIALAIVVGGAWLVRARLGTGSVEAPTSTAVQPEPPRVETPVPNAPPPAPVVLAISLSPAGVRSAEDSPAVTIPPGTDHVVIHLESDGSPHPFTEGRAVVRTVAGSDIWNGPATADASARPPAFARIELPAARLTPDDYIVTLFETPAGAGEVESFRFFLRIRAR